MNSYILTIILFVLALLSGTGFAGAVGTGSMNAASYLFYTTFGLLILTTISSILAIKRHPNKEGLPIALCALSILLFIIGLGVYFYLFFIAQSF